jgi:hypothetical protein
MTKTIFNWACIRQTDRPTERQRTRERESESERASERERERERQRERQRERVRARSAHKSNTPNNTRTHKPTHDKIKQQLTGGSAEKDLWIVPLADVCWRVRRVLTCADLCWLMLTNADDCWRMLKYATKKQNSNWQPGQLRKTARWDQAISSRSLTDFL